MKDELEREFDELFLNSTPDKFNIQNSDGKIIEKLKETQLKIECMKKNEIKDSCSKILKKIQEIIYRYENQNKEIYLITGKIVEKNIEINDVYVGILKKIVYSLTSEERIGLIKELIDNCSENKIFIARLFCVLNEEEKIQIENEIIEYLKMDIYELLLIFKYLGKKNKKNIINLYIDINNIKFLCDIWKDTDKEIQYEMFETILDKILNSKYCDEIVHFISDTAECVKRDKLAFQFFSKVCEKDVYYLIKIWENFSECIQNQYISNIITLIREKKLNKDNQYMFNRIYIDSNAYCQDKLWKFYFKYDEEDKYNIFELWRETKIQLQEKKIFEVINYYKNKESAEFDINRIWMKTNKNVQDKLLNKILNENLENSLKEAIWEGTAEYIQKKNTYLLKNGESIGFWRGTCYSIQNEKFIEYIDKRKCIEDKIEFWCNTNPKVQEKYYDVFLELIKKVFENEILLYKIIKRTSDELKISKLKEIFSIIKNDNEILTKVWEYSSSDFQMNTFESFFIQGNLVEKLWSVTSSLVQDEKFCYVSSIVEKDVKKQISFWKYTAERIQDKNEEYFQKFYEKKIMNTEDMVLFWIGTSFKIQSSNKNILEKIYNRIYAGTENSRELMQKIWNGTSYKLMNNLFSFSRAIKTIYGDDAELDIEYMYNYYNKLLEFNNDLNYTINLLMLDKKILEFFDIGDLLKITLYPDLQEKFVEANRKKQIISIIKMIYKKSDNWISEIDNILNNLENYKHLFDIINDEMLKNEKFCENLISVISVKNNYFNINTLEEIVEYDTIKYNICMDLLNEKLKKIKFVDIKDIKKFALLEILFDVDYEWGKRITEKYSMDIDEINPISDDEKEVKEKIIQIKKIVNGDNLTVNNDNFKKEKINPIKFENKCIKLYERLYNEQMKLPIIKIGKENYENKEVELYKIKDEFCIFVRVEGAYSYWKEPENFENNINEISINLNGNPKTYISNNSMAIARPKGPIYGYTKELKNNLLLMAPWDIVSNEANLSFSPSSVNWNFGNGISFRMPNNLLNNMRSSHNEIVTSKWKFDASTMRIERDRPDVIIYFIDMLEDEITYKETNYWRISKKAAAQLDIPIVIINREEVLKKEKAKIERSLEEFYTTLNENILENIFLQFENNRSSMRYVKDKLKMRYFTCDERERMFEDVIKKISKIDQSKRKRLVNKLIEIADSELSKYFSNKKKIFYEADKDISFYENKRNYLKMYEC